MIPMEERRKFAEYLNRVYSADAPIAGEITLLRCDGTRAHIFGWVTKCINEQGISEFQSVCMDVTERYKARTTIESKRYFQALTDVYDKIFEFNLDTHTVKCLHCEEESNFKHFQNIAVRIEDALAATKAAGFDNLKGHKSVGGLRASIYNAMPKEGIEALVDCLKKFEAEKG